MRVTYEYENEQSQRIPKRARRPLAVAWIRQWAQRRHPRDHVTVTVNERKTAATNDGPS